MHVFELISAQEAPGFAPVWAVVGNDRFLRTLAWRYLEKSLVGEGEATRLDGTSAEWADVADELDSGMLFAQSKHRMVVIDDADTFVSASRRELERLAERGGERASLVLVLNQLTPNAKLTKLLTARKWRIECSEPKKKNARGRAFVDSQASIQWLMQWSQQRYSRRLSRGAAALLWDRVGPIYGLLDQELAKLSLYTDKQIDERLVEQHCGSWRTQTTWEMIDAALDGKRPEALGQLQQLLEAGTPPPSLFGQLSWSLLRYAAAARIYALAEQRGQPISLKAALEASGFRWARETALAETRLRRMGRARALRLPQDLLDLDLKLKGSHSHVQRARQALELFLLSL